MLKPLHLVVAFALAGWLAAPLARAAEDTPKAFLDKIYSAYVGKNAKGVAFSPNVYKRYFTPALAATLTKSDKQSEAAGDPPLLDGDPFIDAQDFDIAKVTVTVAPPSGDRTTAAAAFTNFGEVKTVKYDLVHTKDGWRIDDIHWPAGSLRALYIKP